MLIASAAPLPQNHGMADVVWWEIVTHDPDAFRVFHRALSGWEFEPAFADTDLGADYWIIRSGDAGIGGLQRAAAGTGMPSAGTRIYFEVDDLEAVLARVKLLGGVVERPRTALGGDDRWFGIYRDSAGISIGLWTSSPVDR